MASPLLIGPAESAALVALRELAAVRPVDMPRLMQVIETAAGKAAHMDRMTEQTVHIPVGFVVTFSIETGHGAGTCRHMSMSTAERGHVPTPQAVWLVAEALGFVGGLDICRGWLETLRGHAGEAVNIVQPVSVTPGPQQIQ